MLESSNFCDSIDAKQFIKVPSKPTTIKEKITTFRYLNNKPTLTITDQYYQDKTVLLHCQMTTQSTPVKCSVQKYGLHPGILMNSCCIIYHELVCPNLQHSVKHNTHKGPTCLVFDLYLKVSSKGASRSHLKATRDSESRQRYPREYPSSFIGKTEVKTS